jgi:hypothetical protein
MGVVIFSWYIMGAKHDKVRKNKAEGRLKRKKSRAFLY